MRILLLLACIVILGANLAFAQPGVIAITADPQGTDCNLLDLQPGLLTYWVVHLRTSGATASQWAAPQPVCMIGVIYIADSNQIGPAVGNSQTGISIGYGGCFASPITILSMVFFGYGLTPWCCYYAPTPHPGTGLIEMVDCSQTLLVAGAQCAMVNPDQTCLCAATPTEKSTWGKVKALYIE